MPRSTNLTWGHIKVIMAVEDAKKREEPRKTVDAKGMSIKTLIAEVDKIRGKQPRVLKPGNIESFLNRASRLYSFIAENDFEGVDVGEIDEGRIGELWELHEKIGALLKQLP